MSDFLRHRRPHRRGGAGENKLPLVQPEIKRFLADAVAGDEQFLAVPDGKRVHPPQLGGQVLDPFAVAVQQYFGIAVIGRKMITLGFQLTTQFAVIVNFAVEDDGEISSGPRKPHRLPAPRHVEDRQAGVSKTEVSVDEKIAVIRPATGDNLLHPQQPVALDRLIIETEDATDAAHGQASYPLGGSCPGRGLASKSGYRGLCPSSPYSERLRLSVGRQLP